jgi:N-acetylmuramoyl-L-alanine amidase
MIYLIAGHNNNDPGAVSNGLKESDLTKVIRDLVHERIKQIDSKVLVTKDDDKDSLSQVISKIKPKIQSSDVLLDIHYNSASNVATGIECLVSNNAGSKSIEIAKEICEITHKITGLRDRGVKKESESARGKLGILNMKGSAVIWEVAFINNPNDVKAVNDNLHWICEEIALILIKHSK